MKLAYVTHYTYPSISATQGVALSQFEGPLRKSWFLGTMGHLDVKSKALKKLVNSSLVGGVYSLYTDFVILRLKTWLLKCD